MVKTLSEEIKEHALESATQAYLETLLRVEVDNYGIPLCNTYYVEHFSSEAVTQARRDVRHFIETAQEVIGPYAFDGLEEFYQAERIGHDFALTRNGHGAGFLDRDIPHGYALTELCIVFGPVFVYVGGGGKVHIQHRGGRE